MLTEYFPLLSSALIGGPLLLVSAFMCKHEFFAFGALLTSSMSYSALQLNGHRDQSRTDYAAAFEMSAAVALTTYCGLQLNATISNAFRVVFIAALIGASYTTSLLPQLPVPIFEGTLSIPAVALCSAVTLLLCACGATRTIVHRSPHLVLLITQCTLGLGTACLKWATQYNLGVGRAGFLTCLWCSSAFVFHIRCQQPGRAYVDVKAESRIRNRFPYTFSCPG